jgi:hypothetical protein
MSQLVFKLLQPDFHAHKSIHHRDPWDNSEHGAIGRNALLTAVRIQQFQKLFFREIISF